MHYRANNGVCSIFKGPIEAFACGLRSQSSTAKSGVNVIADFKEICRFDRLKGQTGIANKLSCAKKFDSPEAESKSCIIPLTPGDPGSQLFVLSVLRVE